MVAFHVVGQAATIAYCYFREGYLVDLPAQEVFFIGLVQPLSSRIDSRKRTVTASTILPVPSVSLNGRRHLLWKARYPE